MNVRVFSNYLAHLGEVFWYNKKRMTKDELFTFIQESGLSEEDKKLWQVLDEMPTEKLLLITNFIQKDEERLEFLTNNLKMKMQISRKPDQAKIEKMVQTTEDYLNKLAE